MAVHPPTAALSVAISPTFLSWAAEHNARRRNAQPRQRGPQPSVGTTGRVMREHRPLQEKGRGRWLCAGCPLDGDPAPSCVFSLPAQSGRAARRGWQRGGKAPRCRGSPLQSCPFSTDSGWRKRKPDCEPAAVSFHRKLQNGSVAWCRSGSGQGTTRAAAEATAAGFGVMHRPS